MVTSILLYHSSISGERKLFCFLIGPLLFSGYSEGELNVLLLQNGFISLSILVVVMAIPSSIPMKRENLGEQKWYPLTLASGNKNA